MVTVQKPIKERVYDALKLFKDSFPDLDVCIVGSMSLYLQNIEYKYPHDLDITILNKEMSDEEYLEFRNKIHLMFWKQTGIAIDLSKSKLKKFGYIEIQLFDMMVKCHSLEEYIMSSELNYNAIKDKNSRGAEVYKDKIERLKRIKNEIDKTS